jgi:hypothetical protein
LSDNYTTNFVYSQGKSKKLQLSFLTLSLPELDVFNHLITLVNKLGGVPRLLERRAGVEPAFVAMFCML